MVNEHVTYQHYNIFLVPTFIVWQWSQRDVLVVTDNEWLLHFLEMRKQECMLCMYSSIAQLLRSDCPLKSVECLFGHIRSQIKCWLHPTCQFHSSQRHREYFTMVTSVLSTMYIYGPVDKNIYVDKSHKVSDYLSWCFYSSCSALSAWCRLKFFLRDPLLLPATFL